MLIRLARQDYVDAVFGQFRPTFGVIGLGPSIFDQRLHLFFHLVPKSIIIYLNLRSKFLMSGP